MKRVCVYCGSRSGANKNFVEAAEAIGHAIADRGYEGVYGGGRVGLMGVVADSVLRRGGSIIGVIPEHLATVELTHPDVADMRVVTSMHERKAMMMELSDAFIALPGGFGTMEELFEVLCWRQLGLHANPVGVLNVDGFYDGLQQFLHNMAQSEFLYPGNLDSLIVESDVDKLMARLEQS